MSKEVLQQSIQEALSKGDQDQLESLSKEAVKTYPDDAFGYAYLAEALLMEPMVRFGEAEICLAKAAQLAPQNSTYLAQFAALKSVQGEEGAAQILWGKILSMEPNNVNALTAKGSYQLRVNQDYPQAMDLFNQAIQHDINNAPSYFYRAEAYAGLHQYDKALNDLEHAFSLDNGDPSIQGLLLKIEILRGLNQDEAAAEVYQTILELDPNNPIHQANCAQLLVALGRHREAAVHYGHAVALLNEDDALLSYAWGEALFESQQYAASIEAFDLYVQHAQDPEQGLLMQIQAQLKLGEYDAALERVAHALQGTDNPTTQSQLATFKGDALIGLKRYEEAADVLSPVAEHTGLHQQNAAFLLGKLHFHQGEPAKAYPLVKAAFLKQHEAATHFLRNELQDYVNELQQATLNTNQAAFATNANSAFIQAIQGKIWRFHDFKSQKLSNFGADQATAIKQSLSSITLLVTERGLLQLSPNKAELFTYKIGKDTPKGILALFIALDQLAEFKVKLAFESSGLLTYSKEKGEVLLLEERSPSALEEDIKQQLKRYLQREDFELLGASALAQHIWS